MSFANLDPSILNVVLGSQATIDLPKMDVHSRDEAIQFIFTYGYDINDYKDAEVLWRTHRTAIEILEEEVLDVGEELPPKVRNREELSDLTSLLIIASYADGSALQKYACAILRVMHLIIHLENDLFTSFTDDIQYQILRPITEHISKGEKDSFYLGHEKEIALQDFSIKPFKQTKSGVIKLLAKDNKLAMTLLDRVGIRFITNSIHDIFRVIQYLVDHHLISYPQTIMGQSKNLICPIDVFLEAQEAYVGIKGNHEENFENFSSILHQKLDNWGVNGNQLETPNEFTSEKFKFVKFVSRRFLKIDRGLDKEPLKFFYPFEVQIIDKETFEENEKTSASHHAYKERQRRAARRRVLGFKVED